MKFVIPMVWFGPTPFPVILAKLHLCWTGNYAGFCVEKIKSHGGLFCALSSCMVCQYICRVGGTDLSFIKGDESVAYVALVACELPDCEVVYEDVTVVPLYHMYQVGGTVMAKLTMLYMLEFLDFQEAPALVETFSRLCDTKLNLVPECVLVDGNGILHPRDFGLASHVGELKCCIAIAECRSPCLLGVAKNLYQMDGILRDDGQKHRISLLHEPGDHSALKTSSGHTLGL
ncbi:hypothetical protein Cfor_06221, partial [Coptotermes formosanus]